MLDFSQEPTPGGSNGVHTDDSPPSSIQLPRFLSSSSINEEGFDISEPHSEQPPPPSIIRSSTSETAIRGTQDSSQAPPLKARSLSEPVVDSRGLRIGGTSKGPAEMVSDVIYNLDTHIPYPKPRGQHVVKRTQSPIDKQFVVSSAMLNQVGELRDLGIKLDKQSIQRFK